MDRANIAALFEVVQCSYMSSLFVAVLIAPEMLEYHAAVRREPRAAAKSV